MNLIAVLVVKANLISVKRYSCVAVIGSDDFLSSVKDVKFRGLDGRLLDLQ
jgi:hypothetical protein